MKLNVCVIFFCFPNVATSVTAIEIWLLWCIFFIFFPLLEYALVLIMARIARDKWEEELRVKNSIIQVCCHSMAIVLDIKVSIPVFPKLVFGSRRPKPV